MATSKKYRILSLDGGGIRGLFTLIILEKLSKIYPNWLSQVDLIAGTSSGGIIALGLAYGKSPTELRFLFEGKAKEIFDDSWLDDLVDLGNLRGAHYSNKNLAKYLDQIFGQALLKDLKTKVLIPTFDLDNEKTDPEKRSWAPKFFHNFSGSDSDGHEYIKNIALYTTAAPTYFPTINGYIDGAVIANNPSMAALTQAQDNRSFKRPLSLKNIALLSIGTGQTHLKITAKNLDWGRMQWSKPILDIMFEGNMNIADYQCNQLLGARYHRINANFPDGKHIALDQFKKVPIIIKWASNLNLARSEAWLKKFWLN